MVVANEFQLFQPIGGVGASGVRRAVFDAAASAAPGRVTTAAVAMEVARR
jgi:hypothetical protein